jgi:hypothetical protein
MKPGFFDRRLHPSLTERHGGFSTSELTLESFQFDHGKGSAYMPVHPCPLRMRDCENTVEIISFGI